MNKSVIKLLNKKFIISVITSYLHLLLDAQLHYYMVLSVKHR